MKRFLKAMHHGSLHLSLSEKDNQLLIFFIKLILATTNKTTCIDIKLK